MANPFDFLLGGGADQQATPFGPNAGIDPATGGAYDTGPEQLPWGVQAYTQDRPLESLPTDPTQGQASSQTTNPNDLRGQQNTPWSPPKEDLGIIGNLSRSIYGPSEKERLQTQGFQQDQYKAKQENSATTAVLRRMMQIRENNPSITPQQLAQSIYKDPVFLENALQHSPQEMSEFIGKVQEQIYGSATDQQKIQGFAPGTHVLQGVNPDGSPNVIYKVPEKLAKEPKAATIVTGGSPEAAKYGLEGIAKPGERVQVKFRTTPDGVDIPDSFSFVDHAGVNIDLGQLSNKETLQAVNKAAGDIRVQQGNVINAAKSVDRLIKDIDAQGGAQNIGPVGFILRLGQGFQEQANALAVAAGVTIDPKEYPMLAEILKSTKFSKAGGDASVAQSRILALAFELAAAQNRSSQITQKDVNSALTQIGDGMGSTEQLKANLVDVVRRSTQRLDTFIDVQKDGMLDAEGKPLIPGRLPRRTEDLLHEAGLGRYTYKESDKAQRAQEEADKAATTNPDTGQPQNAFQDSNGDIWDYKGTGSRTDKKNYKKRAIRRASGIATEPTPGPKVPR